MRWQRIVHVWQNGRFNGRSFWRAPSVTALDDDGQPAPLFGSGALLGTVMGMLIPRWRTRYAWTVQPRMSVAPDPVPVGAVIIGRGR